MIKVTLYNLETDEIRQGGEELIEIWTRDSRQMISIPPIKPGMIGIIAEQLPGIAGRVRRNTRISGQ